MEGEGIKVNEETFTCPKCKIKMKHFNINNRSIYACKNCSYVAYYKQLFENKYRPLSKFIMERVLTMGISPRYFDDLINIIEVEDFREITIKIINMSIKNETNLKKALKEYFTKNCTKEQIQNYIGKAKNALLLADFYEILKQKKETNKQSS